MSKEQMYRKKFYEIVSYLKECSEAHIKNKQGIAKEVGVSYRFRKMESNNVFIR